MPIKWKPDTWAMLAQSSPDVFLKELRTQRNPSASLFGDTYLQCISESFRELKKHKNPQHEITFFLELAKLLPHENAVSPTTYKMDKVRNLDTQHAPIEYLLWLDALKKRLNPAAALDFHAWLLQLKKPSYEADHWHDHFSLVNAPEWAAAYVKIQREGILPLKFRDWLCSAPINECLALLQAAGSIHAKEKPIWLTRGLEFIFSNRKDELHNGASVFSTTYSMTTAWLMPSPSLDAAIVTFVLEQPSTTMSFLTRSWFGGYARNRYETHAPMREWWSRQTPEDRGFMLHKWFGDRASWLNLTTEVPQRDLSGVALDLFTREPIVLAPSLARDIVSTAQLEHANVRAFLSRIIPALYVIELTVEPDEIKTQLLQLWDSLHESIPAASIDGLLDFEP